MSTGGPAPVRQHPQYAVIVAFARNRPMVRWMRAVLVSLAIATFSGLVYFAPGMPILGAAAFGGFFLLPLLFGKTRQRAERALRALEGAEPVPATVEFEDYDSERGARFALRTGPGAGWHIRMDMSDLEVNDLARQRDHAATIYPDPGSGAPAAILVGDLLLWQFAVTTP